MDNNNSNRNESYSLNADLATGWRPKLKIIGPMPLNFDNPYIDRILRPLISSDTSLAEVIFLGPRPRDTFQMHADLAQNYRFKYRHLLSADYAYLKPFFKKFYSQFEPEYKRPYEGMNSKIKSDIIFESKFESGNLDCAVRTRRNQFDLFLRIDSNTVGHIMWYHFKMTNTLKMSRTVRLNIVNLRPAKTYYDYCLRPYILRKGREWAQGGENIKVTYDRITLEKNVSFFAQEETDESQFFRKLSFDLEMGPEEEVSLAYSIPYTYTSLLEDIRGYRALAAKKPQIEFSVEYKNQSLSGLDIPYVQISEKDENGEGKKEVKKVKKYCVFIIGRQHPGQANGSHVLNGFLQELLSSQEPLMLILRKYCDFHIIPMLNPDGVVMGNFRTSLYGKDLNRLFKKNETMMLPEVQFSRTLAFDLAKQYKKRMFMFLDFHGHSVRKNAFCYAPGFFQTSGLEDIRQFPKIIASVTQIFRYPSCSFRIANQKKTTARAVFSKFVSLCYTIETSNWAYMQQQPRISVPFDQQKWIDFGKQLTKSLSIFFNIMREKKLKKSKQSEKEKKGYIKTFKTISASKKVLKNSHLQTEENEHRTSVSKRSFNKQGAISERTQPKTTKNSKNKKFQLEEDEETHIKLQKSDNMDGELSQCLEEDENDSDGSEKEDMGSDKFKKYINGAARMFVEFEKAYYGDSYEKKNINLNQFKEKKKPAKPVIMQQACLRNVSQSKEVNLNSLKKEKKAEKSAELGSRSYKNIESSKISMKSKEIVNKNSNIIKLSEMGLNNESSELMTLPKISVINYLALEDEKNEKKQPVFRIPKIGSLHLKNNGIRRYDR